MAGADTAVSLLLALQCHSSSSLWASFPMHKVCVFMSKIRFWGAMHPVHCDFKVWVTG